MTKKDEKKAPEPIRIPVTPAQMKRLQQAQQDAAMAQARASDLFTTVALGTLTEEQAQRAEVVRVIEGDEPAFLVRIVEPEAD